LVGIFVGANECIRLNGYDSSRPHVPTPRGMMPKECVHEVPSNSHAYKEENGIVRVENPDGSIDFFPPCEFSHISRQVNDNGWIVYGVYNGNSFTSFNGTWKVPTAPSTTSDNQTLFMFTGLEDAFGDEIIQPVIQWGPSEAGGGNYWTIANWWVTSSGQALYSTLTKINIGDTILGTMVQHGTGSWAIAASVNSAKPTILNVNNISPQTMASVTLEVYNVLECTDYPADNSITFTKLSLADSGTIVKPTWQPQIIISDCNQDVSSSGPATVTINY